MQTVEEYLNEVFRLIRENFVSADSTGGMPVSAVGYLVKRLIGRDHTQFGFLKFKEVLLQLEQRGLVRTGMNSKNAFSLWLAEQPPPTSVADVNSRGTPRFRPLRKAVWLAFVAATPAGRRFLNRTTGEVRLDAESTLDKDPAWVEIFPVESDSDRKVAADFLKENGVDEAEISASLNSDRWYVDFPKFWLHIPLSWPQAGSDIDRATLLPLLMSGAGRTGWMSESFLKSFGRRNRPHLSSPSQQVTSRSRHYSSQLLNVCLQMN